jgi:hypothetical protein
MTEPPDYAPKPKFAAGDEVEVNMPCYAQGVIVGEPSWHVSGQWQYEVSFQGGESGPHKWTENRLQKRSEL